MDNSQSSTQFELFESTAVRFIVPTPLSGRVNRSSVLPAGIHHSGLLWLLSGFYSAQHRMAKQSASSWQTGRRPVPSFSTAPPRRRSLNCLFTICCGNPQFFIVINNWAVWSGHSTKGCSVHCEAWGGGSLSSVSTHTHTHAPAWRRSWKLSSLPLQLSLALRATSPPLCLHSIQHSCHRSQRSDLPLPPGTTHK